MRACRARGFPDTIWWNRAEFSWIEHFWYARFCFYGEFYLLRRRLSKHSSFLMGKRGRAALALRIGFLAAAFLWALAPRLAYGQEEATEAVELNRPAASREAPEQNIVLEGLDSFGNYRLFAGGDNCHLWNAGVEYDRNSWGRFAGARMDYAAEFLPVVLLNEPANTDEWGDWFGTARKTIYGMGFSPIGLRMVWRDDKGIQPYFEAKGGVLVFDQKALAKTASYEAFSLQESVGMLVKMSPRYDLRLGMFGDFHFSNGFMVPSNPGLDVMNATVGLSYHLGRARTAE